MRMCEKKCTPLRDYVKNINTEKSDKLKIVHLNTQSLRDTTHETEFIDTFSNCGIDIIVASETWYKNTQQFFLLPGYKVYYANRLDRQGGGIAVFVKAEYAVKVLSTSSGEAFRPDYIILDILIGTIKILFAAMYRKPKGGYVSTFVDDFYALSPNYKYSFLCGDLNAGFGRGGDDAEVIPQMLDSCNLQCVPFQATYHTKTCDSILDVICSNCPELLLSFGQTIAAGFSAHDLIFAIFDLSVPQSIKQKITFRNFKKINIESLLVDVENSNWTEVYTENDIDVKVDNFNRIINALMDKHAPVQSKVLRQNSAPWMNNEIRSMIKRRDKLRKKFKKTKCPEDFEIFRKLRNHTKQMTRNAKIKYYYEKFGTEKDTRSLWNTIRSLKVGNSNTGTVDPVVNVNDLNAHYASVSTVRDTTLINNTVHEYESKGEVKVETEHPTKFHFKYVLPEEIINAILSIKSTAIGVDGVSIKFIVLCLPALLPVLDHLFNFSLQHSTFPSVWKYANIIPIPKVKNPQECKDYRPVSILCVLGKVLEKLVHKQITEYLTANNLYADNQSGFRRGYSTITALLKVTDDIRKAMDGKLMTLLVLLDLSKAFDCVHHKLMCSKLKHLGFSDSSVMWFKSYLSYRFHRVFISADQTSDWAEIITGVPQGSVLGPLLFLIYLFDLPDVLEKECSYVMYADDIQLYIHLPLNDFPTYVDKLTKNVRNIITYCEKHNLLLNIPKTQAIMFGTQQFVGMLDKTNIPPLTINGCVVPYSTSVNNLGVIFDCTLSWTEHCNMLVKKVFGIIAQLRRCMSFIPCNIRKALISALVMPHFDYSSVLFTDISDVNGLKLQRLQNACVRFITGVSKFEHITPSYIRLGLMKLKERRMLSVALMVFRIINTKMPGYLYMKYVMTATTNSRSTRSSKQSLQIPVHFTERMHKSFLVQSVNLWNDLQLHKYIGKSMYTVKKIVVNYINS